MSLKYKLIQLNDIQDLFMDIKNENLKNSLLYKLSEDLETIINKYDTIYFKAHNNRKYKRNLITKTRNERHELIMNTHQTVNTFMPYILLYNLTNTTPPPPDQQ